MARKYDFVKVGLGESVLDGKGLPTLNDKGQYNVKSELYNVSYISIFSMLFHIEKPFLMSLFAFS